MRRPPFHTQQAFLDDADRLVAHRLAGLRWLHRGVRPQITAADAGPSDAEDHVGWIDDRWIRNVLPVLWRALLER